MNNKIFVNIASYRDPLLQYTIKNLVTKAKHPENIVLGICWQYGSEEHEELDYYGVEHRVIKVPAFQSKGCSWARSLAFHLHKDEDFFWLKPSCRVQFLNGDRPMSVITGIIVLLRWRHPEPQIFG